MLPSLLQAVSISIVVFIGLYWSSSLTCERISGSGLRLRARALISEIRMLLKLSVQVPAKTAQNPTTRTKSEFLAALYIYPHNYSSPLGPKVHIRICALLRSTFYIRLVPSLCHSPYLGFLYPLKRKLSYYQT